MFKSTADSKDESKSRSKSVSDHQQRRRRLSSMTTPNPASKASVVTESEAAVARLVAEPQHTASRVLAASQSLPSTPVRSRHLGELSTTTSSTIESKLGKSRPPCLAQYGSGRTDSGTSWSSESGAVSPKARARESDDNRLSIKRRKVSEDAQEDELQYDEDARFPNKVSGLASGYA